MAAAVPIVAAVAGGLAARGGGGSTTTVQQADPWGPSQPALSHMYSAALEQAQGPGPQYYPGQTVAGQSDATRRGQQSMFNTAYGYNPVVGNATQQFGRTLNGDYLNANPATGGLNAIAGQNYISGSTPGVSGLYSTAAGANLNSNPYLDSMFKRASSAMGEQFRNNVMPGVASLYAGAGRYGSNAMNEAMGQSEQRYGDALGNLATDIYGGNYANERGMQQAAQLGLGQLGLAGRSQQLNALAELGGNFGKERLLQTQALGMAPQLNAARYMDAQQLMGLGAQQDAYSQSLIDADKARWDYNQNLPRSQLSFLHDITQGAPMGSVSSGNTSMPGNPITGAFGGLMLGSAIQSAMGGQQQPNSMYSLAPLFYGGMGMNPATSGYGLRY